MARSRWAIVGLSDRLNFRQILEGVEPEPLEELLGRAV
jgi:hypothetical protein